MLTSHQTRDLELAIHQYLTENKYSNSADSLQKESPNLKEPLTYEEDANYLSKKWVAILKLQTRINELEQQLKLQDDLISKQVRNLKSRY